MKDFKIRNLYAVYLGGALGALGVSLTSWKFWAVTVPIILLVTLRDYSTNK